MHSLEDALAIIHAATPSVTHPHPLLAHPVSFDGDDTGDEEEDRNVADSGPSALAEALGTLHIQNEGLTSTFFGPTGGGEVRL